MNHTEAREYLLSKPEAFEDYPFGPEVAVYKIGKKTFGRNFTIHRYIVIPLRYLKYGLMAFFLYIVAVAEAGPARGRRKR